MFFGFDVVGSGFLRWQSFGGLAAG